MCRGVGVGWLFAGVGLIGLACTGRSVSHTPAPSAGVSGATAGTEPTGQGGSEGGRAQQAGRGGSAASGGGGRASATGGVAGEPASGSSGEAPEGGAESSGGAGGAGGRWVSAGGEGGAFEAPVIGECRMPSAFSSNLEACEGGFVHRPSASACALPPRDPDFGEPGFPLPEGNVDDVEIACTWDNDCGTDGYCLRDVRNVRGCGVAFYECHTPCEADADCPRGSVCACQPLERAATRETVELGTCRPAQCLTDAVCGRGVLCVAQLNGPVEFGDDPRLGAVDSFRCQTPEDECAGHEFCPDFPSNRDNQYCEGPSCIARDGALVCALVRTCDDTPCEI